MYWHFFALQNDERCRLGNYIKPHHALEDYGIPGHFRCFTIYSVLICCIPSTYLNMGCLKALITCALIASLAQAISMGGDALEDRQESCAQIHLLVARGSTEPPGDGQLGSLAARIIRAHQGATQEAIDYPALLNPYSTSVRAGTAAVLNQLTAYVRRCPNSMVVLLGYSQGAQIIGDALCGGDAAGAGPVTPPMDRNISDHG